MYTRCIYCSGPLGHNETVEEFPVGRTVAFDADRGRLWAVCPRCARWNLAPIEERWEAVESLERRFRDTHLKVQSENVGVSRATDGTRLVRVGAALPGELAAWRYGDRFAGRRRQFVAAAGGAAAITAGAYAYALFGSVALAPVVFPLLGAWTVWTERAFRRPVAALPAGVPGWTRVLTANDLVGVRVTAPVVPGERLSLAVKVPARPRAWWKRILPPLPGEEKVAVHLAEPDAVRVLRRAMVYVNRRGAARGQVQGALGLLDDAGVDGYLRRLPGFGQDLLYWPNQLFGRVPDHILAPEKRLALEMALHEENERRALKGELAALEAAWREAEEIAAIADRLPNVPPPLPPGADPS
jgi:hypothetical protein